MTSSGGWKSRIRMPAWLGSCEGPLPGLQVAAFLLYPDWADGEAEDRIPWLCSLHDILVRDVASGQHVILACSALKKMYRDILTRGKEGAPLKRDESGKEEKPAELQLLVVHLSGSFEVISGRLLKRKGHFMPPELLQSQFDTLEPPSAPENFIQVSVEKNLPEIVATIMETLK
ncbi:probable gluconokinase isoform X4 [Equus quagga]|uniref:probable gluconokinase isoform X4 n=1 Tax=Equus quagga TaxID=89248 RepID=UPI001EE290F8|nr:probable gluconokinase isoform X4 [Equus quagga]XP_046520697.1 probable gluconokinase isoform X4 [Equus quagga]XP_046520698.1 probable gluconokinase isoform X4 [Equus quagga]